MFKSKLVESTWYGKHLSSEPIQGIGCDRAAPLKVTAISSKQLQSSFRSPVLHSFNGLLIFTMPKIKLTVQCSTLSLLTLFVLLSSGMVSFVAYLGSKHSIRFLITKAYDPRNRLWYQRTIAQKEFIWTYVYIFYADRQPGISRPKPIYDSSGKLEGIMGIDITIAELSYFLGGLKILNQGKAFIFNKNHEIVALRIQSGKTLSGLMEHEKEKSEEPARFLSVDRVRDRAIGIYFQEFQELTSTTTAQFLDNPFYFNLSLNGATYLAISTQNILERIYKTSKYPHVNAKHIV